MQITDSATSIDWPQGQVITVDLYGKETGKTDTRIDDYALTNPAPAGAAYTVELKTETINGKTYKSYEFTIPHLDAKYDSFYVIEQELPGYFTIYGALQESTLVTGQGRDRAGEGEYIINRVVKVSLPETGGPGTSMIYLLGIALIVLAGGGYILRNRRLLVTRPGSGHSHPGKTARTFGQAITAPAEGNSLISWRRGVQVSAAIIPGGESSGERGDSGTGST